MKNTGKWAIVSAYTIGFFAVTPYLPQLIRAANARWSIPGVSRFVLGVEIVIALVLTALAVKFLIQKKKKSLIFLVSIGCIFLLSFIIYQFIPNPYEFTHLPEYAVLSMLIIWALNNKGEKSKDSHKNKKNNKSEVIKNPYILSVFITSTIGTIDEIFQHFLPNRFFTVYDIFLNILGGILGLLIFWGIRRPKIPETEKK